MDTFCLINRAWYEAKVVKVELGAEPRVLVHFKGWGKSADEWIGTASDRLRPHKLHTCGTDYKAELANLVKGVDSGSKRQRPKDPKDQKAGRVASAAPPAKAPRRPAAAAAPAAFTTPAAFTARPATAATAGKPAKAASSSAGGGLPSGSGRCEACGASIDGSYGSGRFCHQGCRSKWNGRQYKSPTKKTDAD
jgi:hypothetical protein